MNECFSPLNIWLKKIWLIALLLSGATFILLSPTIGYDFINYDDNLYVFENPQVLQGLSWAGLLYGFQTIDGISWTPLTWLSYMLDTSLFGAQPAGYHLTNILLHSINVGLLFIVLQRMTQKIWPALLAAALFAFHPQHLESVVWIAERKDVLSMFFWILGLFAYLHYSQNPGARRMIWVILCLICGVMAKPMVVTFPLVLLLLDFWPLRRLGGSIVELRIRARPLLLEKIPLAIICAAAAAATIWSQGSKGAIITVHIPWYLKIFQVIDNIGFYIRKFFVPDNLALLYRPENLDYLSVLATGLFCLAISILVLRRAGCWPWLTVGWYWFLFTLAPVIGIFRIGDIAVADRYNYLPSIGLAVAVAYSVEAFAAHWPRIRSGLMGAMAGWVCLCALTVWADLPRWQNTYTVFLNAYRNSGHFIACDQLGSLLYTRQEYRQSLVVCNRGLEQNPQYASLYNTRGGDYYMLNDFDNALADFNRAIESKPTFSPPYYSRALIHIQRKQFTEAQADFTAYLQYGGQTNASKFNSTAQ